jgi:hypothetical protein
MALLVGKDRRHLLVTPCDSPYAVKQRILRHFKLQMDDISTSRLKGRLTRDFRFQVFFTFSFPLASEYPIGAFRSFNAFKQRSLRHFKPIGNISTSRLKGKLTRDFRLRFFYE